MGPGTGVETSCRGADVGRGGALWSLWAQASEVHMVDTGPHGTARDPTRCWQLRPCRGPHPGSRRGVWRTVGDAERRCLMGQAHRARVWSPGSRLSLLRPLSRFLGAQPHCPLGGGLSRRWAFVPGAPRTEAKAADKELFAFLSQRLCPLRAARGPGPTARGTDSHRLAAGAPTRGHSGTRPRGPPMDTASGEGPTARGGQTVSWRAHGAEAVGRRPRAATREGMGGRGRAAQPAWTRVAPAGRERMGRPTGPAPSASPHAPTSPTPHHSPLLTAPHL